MAINPGPDSLTDLLHWVQAYIRNEAQWSPNDIEAVILPNGRMSSTERLQLYRRLHRGKTGRSMRRLMPALARFMGGAQFDRLIEAYLRAGPMQSDSLSGLKDGLPDFLAGMGDMPFHGFVLELAQLEVAVRQLEGMETPTPLTIAYLLQHLDWIHQRLVPVPCMRRMSFQYRVHDFLASRQKSTAQSRLRWAESSPNEVLLLRQGLVVTRFYLDEPDRTMLSALLAGTPPSRAADLRARTVQVRLEAWIRAGLFASVEPL